MERRRLNIKRGKWKINPNREHHKNNHRIIASVDAVRSSARRDVSRTPTRRVPPVKKAMVISRSRARLTTTRAEVKRDVAAHGGVGGGVVVRKTDHKPLNPTQRLSSKSRKKRPPQMPSRHLQQSRRPS
jgi:hypothetical protein